MHVCMYVHTCICMHSCMYVRTYTSRTQSRYACVHVHTHSLAPLRVGERVRVCWRSNCASAWYAGVVAKTDFEAGERLGALAFKFWVDYDDGDYMGHFYRDGTLVSVRLRLRLRLGARAGVRARAWA